MAPQSSGFPGFGNSNVAKPRDGIAVLGTCEEIEVATEDIFSMLGKFDEDTNLVLIRTIQRSSDWVWKKVLDCPVHFLPTIRESVYEYRQILFDLRETLQSTSLSIASAEDFSKRIDSFIDGLKKKLVDERSPHNQRPTSSPSFFPYSHNFIISGGTFTSVEGITDPTLHEQSRKILQMQRIQLCVLFVSSGHK